MSSAEPESVSAAPAPLSVSGSAAASAAPMETSVELADIDASVRVPTLLFFASGVAWLLAGSALGVIAWVKMVMPCFLTNIGWFTIGRLWPAQQDAFVYGWAGSTGIGAGLWMMARLCRVPLRHGGVLTAAWGLWNIGLLLGIVGILNGESTSVQWLEFPRLATPLIFTAYSFIAIWAVLMFRYRREGHTYISQWYLLASFLWFPWSYATVNLIQFFLPVQPAAQEVVHWWYVGSLFGLWLAPTALATLYYIVPRTLGQPIHRYGLAVFAFWSLLFLSSWSGLARLIGGPIPAWMITVSIVAAVASALPVLAIAGNFTGVLSGRYRMLRRSPSLRFATVGMFCFLAASALGIVTSFRWLSALTHFTQVEAATEQLFLAGFVGLSLFAAVYYIVPRLLGREWASSELIRWHFWTNAVGLSLAVVSLLLGGFLQGLGLQDAKVPSAVVLDLLQPFLVTAGLGVLLMAVGNVIFTANLVLFVLGAAHRAINSRGEPARAAVVLQPAAAAPVSVP